MLISTDEVSTSLFVVGSFVEEASVVSVLVTELGLTVVVVCSDVVVSSSCVEIIIGCSGVGVSV